MRSNNPEREFTNIVEFLEFAFPALTIEEPVPQSAVTGPSTKAVSGAGPRRDEHRAACRDFLAKWRVDCWLENHNEEVWGPAILLPEKVLTKLAATASLRTKEDIRDEVEGWLFWERYSQHVLDGLREIDMRFEATKAAREADRLQQQQIERDRRLAIAQEQRQRVQEEKEEKRRLKEAAAQQERSRKEEAKRHKEELKRQNEQRKAEARRQKEQLKRQKEEEKEEMKRQKDEKKRQREEAKRQREERRGESGEREGKRQRTDLNSFIPASTSSPSSPPSFTPPLATPVQPTPSTQPRQRPRPRPTKRPPPSHNVENFDPAPPIDPPHPLPSPAGPCVQDARPQLTLPLHQNISLFHSLWQSTPSPHHPHPGIAMTPLRRPLGSPSHSHILLQPGLTGGRTNTIGTYGPADLRGD